ncbi:MAG: endonuclease/exonuclease/phosphatase family protein [Clostridia bacterium]|nr:endonuclease/exonuclease/phosphatase family protein [Clostridia bacterium]
MRKIVALLLVFIMCLPVLAACNKGEDTPEETTETSVPVSVVAGGTTEYAIVYASSHDEMGNASYAMAKLIQKTVKSATGVEMTLVSESGNSQAKEIIVGKLSREETFTSPVSAETYQMGYSVFMSGDKIVLEAGSVIGLRFATYAFLKDLLGVDLHESSEVALNESKTEFTVSSGYTASETLTSAEFPYMGVALAEFGICFSANDDAQKRAAIILQQEIKSQDGVALERLNSKWAEEGKAYFYFEKDETVNDGNFRIKTEGKKIILSAKDYHGYFAAAHAVVALREDLGYYPFRDGKSDTGSHVDYLETYEKSSAYVYNNSSEYRLMFYNVFWGKTENEEPERSAVQVEVIKAYCPDVIGFQEFRADRRDMVPMLKALGYEETMDYQQCNVVSGSSGATDSELYNYAPIFYNSATTKCIDKGFYRYTEHSKESERASKCLSWAVMASKSTGEKYLVVNTHMTVGSESSIKEKQAKEVVNLITELMTRYNVPVFLGGDFNGKYHEANFKYFEAQGFKDVEKNNLATEYTSKLKTNHIAPANKSSYGLLWPVDNDDTEINSAKSVDHIMIKNASNVSISVYGVVADNYAMSGGDHYPIFTDFSIQ